MLLTVKEAENMWCPFMEVDMQRDCNCLGFECMAWEWAERAPYTLEEFAARQVKQKEDKEESGGRKVIGVHDHKKNKDKEKEEEAVPYYDDRRGYCSRLGQPDVDA